MTTKKSNLFILLIFGGLYYIASPAKPNNSVSINMVNIQKVL